MSRVDPRLKRHLGKGAVHLGGDPRVGALPLSGHRGRGRRPARAVAATGLVVCNLPSTPERSPSSPARGRRPPARDPALPRPPAPRRPRLRPGARLRPARRAPGRRGPAGSEVCAAPPAAAAARRRRRRLRRRRAPPTACWRRERLKFDLAPGRRRRNWRRISPCRPRMPAPASRALDPIFSPRSVAVIGASRSRDSLGWALVHNLVRAEFQGAIYPVNPKAASIHSLKCYPTIGAIPDPIDLAVVTVPRDLVLGVVDECLANGGGRPGGDHRRLLGDRRGGPRARERAAREGARRRRPHDRPQLHGGDQHRRRRAARRDLLADPGRAGLDRLRQPVGGARRGRAQRRRRARPRAHPVRLDGQQGRHLGQRPARALGARSGDPGDLHVPRVVRQPAPLHRDRQARLAPQADPGGQVGPHRGGGARRLEPHRRARRRRRHGHGLPRAVRGAARRHHRGAVRHRPCLRPLPAARRAAGGDPDQRRRPGILATDACVSFGLQIPDPLPRHPAGVCARSCPAWRASPTRST